MKTFIWDVTYFCPLLCTYCYSNSGPTQRRPNGAHIWKVAEAIARERPDRVLFSGGEPALVREIGEIATEFKSRGILCSIFTSGWGLTEPRVRVLSSLFDRIHVSIDAVDPHLNDAIRGRDGAHSQACNTLSLLSSHCSTKPRSMFGVECSVVNSNLGQLAEFSTFIASSFPGLRFIVISPAIPSGRGSQHAYTQKELLEADQLTCLLSQRESLRRLMPPTVDLEVVGPEYLKHDDERLIHITPNGEVRAMKACEKTVGNLITESLGVILERARQWREGSPLARALKTVPDFVKWGEIVRSLDEEHRKTAGVGDKPAESIDNVTTESLRSPV